MTNKSKIALGILCVVLVIGGVSAASRYMSRWTSTFSIQHKIIQPKAGKECVVVSTTSAVATDCWDVPVAKVGGRR